MINMVIRIADEGSWPIVEVEQVPRVGEVLVLNCPYRMVEVKDVHWKYDLRVPPRLECVTVFTKLVGDD